MPNNVPANKPIETLAVKVLSANLVGVYDKNNQFTGVRILGEMENIGSKFVETIDPIVRFYDGDGVQIGQRIANHQGNQK